MNRLRNYGLWVSVASLAFMLFQEVGFQITPDKWEVYVNSILGILILLGIINNPSTENKGFLDDRK
jgi:uncharacterized membrane protein